MPAKIVFYLVYSGAEKHKNPDFFEKNSWMK